MVAGRGGGSAELALSRSGPVPVGAVKSDDVYRFRLVTTDT